MKRNDRNMRTRTIVLFCKVGVCCCGKELLAAACVWLADDATTPVW
jgi:hypothetical protein